MSISEVLRVASVSLGVHPLEDVPAEQMAAGLVDQARTAERSGFDGVTISEHHGRFPAYMGQPLLAATWMLASTDRLWAAPCPTLLNLRNPLELAEAVAWTSAAFPGRVALGVAAGYYEPDFDAWEVPFDDVAPRFETGLSRLRAALDGEGPLADDPAIRGWIDAPGPLLSAANSRTGARRAAAHRMGIYLSGHMGSASTDALLTAYRIAGGEGPVVMVKRVWLGAPPAHAVERLVSTYRAAGAPTTSDEDASPPIHAGSADQIVEEVMGDATRHGVSAVNFRVHLPAVPPSSIIEQIERLGIDIVPRIRHELSHVAG
ncbi:MAG: LLM class flavin-dependent oxidoreductase [Acidimicrobiia bacterium]